MEKSLIKIGCVDVKIDDVMKAASLPVYAGNFGSSKNPGGLYI